MYTQVIESLPALELPHPNPPLCKGRELDFLVSPLTKRCPELVEGGIKGGKTRIKVTPICVYTVAFIRGVSFIEFGVSFIEFGESFIEFGKLFIEFGVLFIEFRESFIEFGVLFIEFGESFIEFGVSFIIFVQF
ncbi:hypothetical protein [Nostoc punctiforme]|uniref:hypothetical protein n=1 Tax=Nostoc punctiforme TaxID=272131 RepID=UPI0030EF854E